MTDKPELIEALTKVDSPTLSNAIEKLAVRNRTSGFCDNRMRQFFPEMGVMCGYAVTAQAVTMAPDAAPVDGVEMFCEVCRALEATPKPAVVVIQECGPHPDFAVHCGDVMATMFQRFGAIGLVSDTAVRDVDQVRPLGFQLFAPGAAASHANFKIVRVQVPVTVRGLQVEPGDLLHGDVNGLLKVPEEGRERLQKLVDEVVEQEGKILDYLKGDNVDLEKLKRIFTH